MYLPALRTETQIRIQPPSLAIVNLDGGRGLRTLEEVSGESLIYQVLGEVEDLFLFNHARKK